MKAVLTGSTGTVGSALSKHLSEQGAEVIGWDRSRMRPGDQQAAEKFLREAKPDVLFHLAVASQPAGIADEYHIVGTVWPEQLAELTRRLDIRFVFTSSVMVFSDDAKGPFTPETSPDAAMGYGAEKRRAEELIRHANADAIIARLGWQIGGNDVTDRNDMASFLERQWKAEGVIRASSKWFPACSFLSDTAAALTQLASMPGSSYLLDANRQWSFYDICVALRTARDATWHIEATEDFIYDQRMIDLRIELPSLKVRLPDLH
ncbi:MAG: sugar nucleotide-binding protein [Rhizobacter sp.]|nr:sugar nucleotide-binding protein [Chlorobiales bacterium]